MLMKLTPDGMTSADQPEMFSRSRGRSLALIVHSGNSPIEVLPSHYHNHSRRLNSTISFNSVWISGYKLSLTSSYRPVVLNLFLLVAHFAAKDICSTPKMRKISQITTKNFGFSIKN